MIEHENGRVSGSVDRARVAELLGQTDDEDLKAHYREVLGESEEGKAAAESTDDHADDQDASVAPAAEPGNEPAKPSMALSKPELVELAQGKVDDPDSKTKAELVEALGGEA